MLTPDLSEVLRNLFIIAAGAVGLYLAWRRLSALDKQTAIRAEQSDIDRRRQAMDHFRQFCEGLDDDSEYVRIAAVEGLIELASAYPDILLAAVTRVLGRFRVGPNGDDQVYTDSIEPFLNQWNE